MSRETPMQALSTDASTDSLVREILSEIKNTSKGDITTENYDSSSSASKKIAQQNSDLFFRQTESVSDDPFAPQTESERKLLEDQTLGLKISSPENESSEIYEKSRVASTNSASVEAYVSSTLFDTVLQKGYELSQVVFLFAFLCFVVSVYLAPQLNTYINNMGFSYLISALIGGILYAVGASITNTNATLVL